MLALAITSAPRRPMLSDIFTFERAAGILGVGGEAAAEWKAEDQKKNPATAHHSLCGRLVNDGGSVDREIAKLQDMLTSPESPLASPLLFRPDRLKINRALGLNANASHWVRVKEKTNN